MSEVKKYLSWVPVIANGASPIILCEDNNYGIIQALDSNGLLVEGAENIVKVLNPKMLDESFTGDTMSERLKILSMADPESSCLRGGETVLNDAPGFSFVLVLQFLQQ